MIVKSEKYFFELLYYKRQEVIFHSLDLLKKIMLACYIG